jgi:HEAT repeat protein
MLPFVFIVLSLVSQPVSAEVPGDVRAQWLSTLRFGIDSQVVELVQKIRDSKDSTFGPDLALVLAKSRNPDVQKAILDLLADQVLKDAEETAKGICAGWQDLKSDIVLSAVRYLSAVHASGISKDLISMMAGQDNALSLQAIDALGKSGDLEAGKALLEKLKSADFPEERKPQLILAIGNLKDPAAVDTLIAIVKNPDEQSVNRMYAADSLGKIGDAKAIPVLRNLLKATDALSRAYAAGALVNFDVSQVIDELFQGLRDDNWRVRVECAKALARPLPADRVGDAVSILTYKAQFDPVVQVRLEAIGSLAAIGGEAAMGTILGIYKDVQASVDVREKSLAALVGKGLSSTLVDAIRAAIDADWNARNTKALQSEAKVLSAVRYPGLEPIFDKLLGSPDSALRIYAIKGIEINGFSGLKVKLMEIAAKDPFPYIQAEAKRVAGGL